jgi:hypothetical protein
VVDRHNAKPIAAEALRFTAPKSRPKTVTMPAPVRAALLGVGRLATGAATTFDSEVRPRRSDTAMTHGNQKHGKARDKAHRRVARRT